MVCLDCSVAFPAAVGRGRRRVRCPDCQHARRLEARRRRDTGWPLLEVGDGQGRLAEAVETDVAGLPGAHPGLAVLALRLAAMADRRLSAPIVRELRLTLVALFALAAESDDGGLDAFLTSIGPV